MAILVLTLFKSTCKQNAGIITINQEFSTQVPV